MNDKKEEALKRLQILTDAGLSSIVKEKFEKNNIIYCSNMTYFQTLCYGELIEFNKDTLVNPSWIDTIRRIESEYNCLVYHITRESTQFGDFLDLFIVSDETGRWNADKDDLNKGLAYSYVINTTIPEFSELMNFYLF